MMGWAARHVHMTTSEGPADHVGVRASAPCGFSPRPAIGGRGRIRTCLLVERCADRTSGYRSLRVGGMLVDPPACACIALPRSGGCSPQARNLRTLGRSAGVRASAGKRIEPPAPIQIGTGCSCLPGSPGLTAIVWARRGVDAGASQVFCCPSLRAVRLWSACRLVTPRQFGSGESRGPAQKRRSFPAVSGLIPPSNP